jgi:hypothetical protein
MNDKDESFLSAYLDDQLDPDEQQRVEAALASDPRLAEELRSLSGLRDVMAGLSREASVDVAPQVMDRISRRRARARSPLGLLWLSGHLRVLGPVGAAGLAAGFLLVISLASFVLLRSPVRVRQSTHPVIGQNSSQAVQTEVHPPTPALPATRALASEVARRDRPTAALDRTARGDGDAAQSPSGPSRWREPDQLRHFLDHPNVRRFLVLCDGAAGEPEQKVASVIEQSTRFGFYKLTIAHGVVIDPRHPQEATVFALLVDPQELTRLRERLRAAVPDRVEEPSVDPAVITQLADIGQVEGRPPAPLGDVMIPREGLALRTPSDAQNAEIAVEAERNQPTPEQYRSAPLPVPVVDSRADPTEPRPGTDHAPAAGLSSGTRSDRSGAGPARAGEPPSSRFSRPDSTRSPRPMPGRRQTSQETIVVLVWVAKGDRS